MATKKNSIKKKYGKKNTRKKLTRKKKLSGSIKSNKSFNAMDEDIKKIKKLLAEANERRINKQKLFNSVTSNKFRSPTMLKKTSSWKNSKKRNIKKSVGDLYSELTNKSLEIPISKVVKSVKSFKNKKKL
tara:strand:- start:12419 stop:12808 length:390 start_codon:yes stop_codon:yes gene_type:complete